MSTNNYILNVLNIKDKNSHIITECKENVIKIIETFKEAAAEDNGIKFSREP